MRVCGCATCSDFLQEAVATSEDAGSRSSNMGLNEDTDTHQTPLHVAQLGPATESAMASLHGCVLSLPISGDEATLGDVQASLSAMWGLTDKRGNGEESDSWVSVPQLRQSVEPAL